MEQMKQPIAFPTEETAPTEEKMKHSISQSILAYQQESKKSFAELYANDIFNSENGHGIKLLTDSNMSLVFRFSNFLPPSSPSNKYKIEGRAVLLITNSQKSNINNFLDFMSNEKIRLLLLIKEELLDYLQKQFDNDAFFDVIESRKKAVYQKHLRHGVGKYVANQIQLVENILNGHITMESYELFHIVTEAIRVQLKATKIENISDRKSIVKEDFIRNLRLIFESNLLGDRTIDFSELDISGLNFEKIDSHPCIFDAVIPELVINMKKYCPRRGNKGLLIKYVSAENQMIFKNIINGDLNVSDYGGGEGINMCRFILDALKLPHLETNDNNLEFTVTLKV